MNTQSNTQPQSAKKLTVKKTSIRVLTQGQINVRPTTGADEPTQYCTFPC